MKLSLILLVASVTAVGAWRSTSTATEHVTLHQAKVRTFAAALAETEQQPDASDATHAAIVVRACKRYRSGWLCHTELQGVTFSGFDAGFTCPLLVNVQPQRTTTRDSQCH